MLAPSREIAIQLHEYLALLAQSNESVHDKTVLVIGGIDLKEQRKVLLVKRPKVVVATLGRLLEMIDKEYIGLERLEILALDEADKFSVRGKKKTWQDIDRLLADSPKSAQIVAFSATYSDNQLLEMTKKMEERGPVTKLFV